MTELGMEVNNRVKRKKGEGCHGTIDFIRTETNTSAADRPKDNKYLVRVKWDNGSVSYCSPDALEILSQ